MPSPESASSTCAQLSALSSPIPENPPFSSWIPDSALSLGTGILSAFMISARLPRLQQKLHGFLDRPPLKNWLPRLQAIRHALWGWLKAQGALCGICFCILLVGFWLLGIRNALLWAAVIALVDYTRAALIKLKEIKASK